MSNEHDRDELTDRLLRRSFTTGGALSEPGAACVDAETIAAWVDGGLDRVRAAQVETHLSTCVHCQAVLGTFAVTESAVQPTSAPAVVPFWQRWSMRWAIPMTAGATAVLLWSVLQVQAPDQTASQTMARVEQPQVIEAPPPGIVGALPTDESKFRQSDLQGPGQGQGETSAERDRAMADRSDLARQERVAPLSEMSKAAGPSAEARFAPSPPPVAAPPAPQRVVGGIAPPPSPTAAAPAKPGDVSPMAAPVEAPREIAPEPPSRMPSATLGQGAASSRAATQASDAASQVQSGGLRAELGRSSGNQAGGVAAVAIVAEFSAATVGGGRVGRGSQAAPIAGAGRGGGSVASTQLPAQRWRVLADGSAQRAVGSLDWESVVIDPPAFLTSGAAPSATVCWLVGRSGVVLRTTDGRTFVRVSIPEVVDILAVTASSALEARVTAVGGRVFSTTDGGLNWR